MGFAEQGLTACCKTCFLFKAVAFDWLKMKGREIQGFHFVVLLFIICLLPQLVLAEDFPCLQFEGRPLFQQGHGTFDIDGPNYLRVADFDRNGTLDIISFDFSTALLEFHFLGQDGTYTSMPYEFSSQVSIGYDGMEIGDLDEDGDIDVIYTGVGAKKLVVIKNLGAQRFSSPIDIGASLMIFASAVEIADLNQDGLNDIVALASTASGWQLLTFLNNGNGQFPSAQTRSTTQAATLLVADMFGDEAPEIILNRTSRILTISTLDGSVQVDVPIGVRIVSIEDVENVSLGDINGDGRKDFIIVSLNSIDFPSGFQVVTNLGNGSFSPPTSYIFPMLEEYSVLSSVLVNISGDAAPELVASLWDNVSGTPMSSLAIFPNADGQFLEPTLRSISIEGVSGDTGAIYRLYPTDTNADALVDLIAFVRNWGAQVLLNRSSCSRFIPPGGDAACQSRVLQLEAENAELQRALDELTAEVEILRREAAAVTQLKQALAEATEKLLLLEQDLTTTRQQLVDAQKKIKSLEEQLRKCTSKKAEKNRTITKLLKRTQKLSQQCGG